jgi:tetratricopeptide (TPR) repeat protein
MDHSSAVESMNVRAPSRFTPSLLSHELLEELFVARAGLLDEIMARVRSAATSANRSHTLLVGPRGAGKTHIVSLVAHRTEELRAEGSQLRLAWLVEDLWAVDSYESLIRLIADEAGCGGATDGVLSVTQIEAALSGRVADQGPIVVIIENLDQVLDALDDTEQQRLRAMLANGTLLFVATTTQLSRHLSDQAVPFYGFFTVTRLAPFDVAEGAEMLARIATYGGDTTLADYLRSGRATPRLQAVAHLAGGTPRMWATLASALTVRQLDELVELLLTRFDDLTPYYQEQLAQLSPQQRKVVAKIVELDRPVGVKELAVMLRTPERSIASVLGDLKERGWVRPTDSILLQLVDKRRTYYELSEPLARLAFQLKAARGKPVRLLVDFLKTWFEPAELEAASSTSASAAYVSEALDSCGSDSATATAMRLWKLPTYRMPIVSTLAEVDCALSDLESGDPSAMFLLPSVLRAAVEAQLDNVGRGAIRNLREIIHNEAMSEFGFVRHPAMDEWIDRADAMCLDGSGPFLFGLILWLSRAWRFDEVELLVEHFAEMVGPDHANTLLVRNNLANAYWHAGRTDEAIALQHSVLADRERILGADHPSTLITRNNLANSYQSAGQVDKAITLLEAVLASRERTLGTDHPSTLITRNNLANSYQSAGQVDKAITLLEAVVADSEQILGNDHPDTLLSRSNLAQAYKVGGLTGRAITIFENVLADRERTLGADHPETLITRNNLASCYRTSGRIDDAISLQELVLVDRERILGADHPSTLITRNNLAVSYQSAGRTGDAIAMLRGVLVDSERTMGHDHPETVMTRSNLDAMTSTGSGPRA